MIRCSSSAAALFVKVSPRIWEAETSASSVSHTTRAAMTAVLPLPAPAMMARGTGSWTIAAHCSSLGSWPRRAARTAALARRLTAAPPGVAHRGRQWSDQLALWRRAAQRPITATSCVASRGFTRCAAKPLASLRARSVSWP